MKRILFVFLLCSISNSYPQRFVFGLRNESSFLITNDFENHSSNSILKFSPINLTFSLLFKFNNASGINVRPGLAFNGIDYVGPELGVYYHQNILYDLYLYGGGKAHLSIPDNPNNNTYAPTFLSLGLGYHLSKILCVEITLNKALKGKYANNKPLYVYSLNRSIDDIKEIYYDLRFGFGITIN